MTRTLSLLSALAVAGTLLAVPASAGSKPTDLECKQMFGRGEITLEQRNMCAKGLNYKGPTTLEPAAGDQVRKKDRTQDRAQMKQTVREIERKHAK